MRATFSYTFSYVKENEIGHFVETGILHQVVCLLSPLNKISWLGNSKYGFLESRKPWFSHQNLIFLQKKRDTRNQRKNLHLVMHSDMSISKNNFSKTWSGKCRVTWTSPFDGASFAKLQRYIVYLPWDSSPTKEYLSNVVFMANMKE